MQESNQATHPASSSSYTANDLINEYYETYIIKAINYTKKSLSVDEIFTILSMALKSTDQQFDIDLENYIKAKSLAKQEAFKIHAIYSIIHRMLTGTLTTEDGLLANLTQLHPKKSIEDLNEIVKKHITIDLLLPERSHLSVQNMSETQTPKI